MIRFALLLLICLCPLHSADEVAKNDDAKIMAAAKQANLFYQNRRSALLRQLKTGSDDVKVKAIAELSTLQEAELIGVILPYLDFNLHSDKVVSAACLGLARLDAQNHIADLTKITQHQRSSKNVKKAAWNAIGRLKSLERVHFNDQSGDFETAIRASGVTNLGTIKDAEAAPILANAVVHDRRVHIRRMAAIGLGKLGDPEYAEQLIIALTDGDIQVRRFASTALAKMDHKPAIPYLLVQLESNVGGKYLNQALMVLSGQDFGYKHTDTLTARRDAIAAGITWYTEHSKDF